VAFALGLRQGEALGLPWDAVNLDAGTLTVRQALQRQTGAGLVIVEPESQAGRRTISVPRPLIDALLRGSCDCPQPLVGSWRLWWYSRASGRSSNFSRSPASFSSSSRASAGGGVEKLPWHVDPVDAPMGQTSLHRRLDADGVVGEEQCVDVEVERYRRSSLPGQAVMSCSAALFGWSSSAFPRCGDYQTNGQRRAV
jgi:hypothetical protein